MKPLVILQDKLKSLPGFKPGPVNRKVKKDSPKVVDSIDIEDMGDKVRICFTIIN